MSERLSTIRALSDAGNQVTVAWAERIKANMQTLSDAAAKVRATPERDDEAER